VDGHGFMPYLCKNSLVSISFSSDWKVIFVSSSEVALKCELKSIRAHLQLHGVMSHGVPIGTVFSPCCFGICYYFGSSVQNIFGHDVPNGRTMRRKLHVLEERPVNLLVNLLKRLKLGEIATTPTNFGVPVQYPLPIICH